MFGKKPKTYSQMKNHLEMTPREWAILEIIKANPEIETVDIAISLFHLNEDWDEGRVGVNIVEAILYTFEEAHLIKRREMDRPNPPNVSPRFHHVVLWTWKGYDDKDVGNIEDTNLG